MLFSEVKMKRIVLFTTIVVLFVTTANAGVLDIIKGVFTNNVLAYVITIVLGFGVIGGSVWFIKTVKALKEVGEFLTVLGIAAEDKKITKEELVSIIKEGKDIINVWKK